MENRDFQMHHEHQSVELEHHGIKHANCRTMWAKLANWKKHVVCWSNPRFVVKQRPWMKKYKTNNQTKRRLKSYICQPDKKKAAIDDAGRSSVLTQGVYPGTLFPCCIFFWPGSDKRRPNTRSNTGKHAFNNAPLHPLQHDGGVVKVIVVVVVLNVDSTMAMMRVILMFVVVCFCFCCCFCSLQWALWWGWQWWNWSFKWWLWLWWGRLRSQWQNDDWHYFDDS